MSPIDIARIRARGSDDPRAFMLAFHAGLRAAELDAHAAESDADAAQFLRSLLADEHASSAAGFLEGLAAANAAAGNEVAA